MAKKISVKGLNPVIHELPRSGLRPGHRPGVRELPIEGRRPVKRPGLQELPVAFPRPGINELPYDSVFSATTSVIVGEVDAIRARLNAIENEILNLKLGRGGVVGNPHELPAEMFNDYRR
jgi:hypothetical protein